MRTPLTYRFGMPVAGQAVATAHDCEVACQVPPLLLSITIPARNPSPLEKLALQGPHHAAATYSTPPMVTASSAVTCEAAFPPTSVRSSKMFCQPVVPAIPASEFHTIAPPETRWLELVRSM